VALIEVKNFRKKFGSKRVISDLSFEVEQGEIFAFLGANGSGKTTTLRALLGIYLADGGSLLIDGRAYGPEMSSLIGYLPEERGLYLESTPLEIITFFGKLKQLSSDQARAWTLQYLERVGLSAHAKQKIKSLSSGQQQKIQLGVTLVNQPRILILDEPTKGLDPVNRQLLMDILAEMNTQQGTTILFSTHIMDEVEKIAHRLMMIKHGERKLYGTVADVKRSFGGNTAQIGYKGSFPANEALYSIDSLDTNFAEIRLQPNIEPNDVIAALLKSNLQLTKFTLAEPTLQQIFIQVEQNND
jgi:ABC-2 type transport system ATP-binding protein